MDIIMIGFWIWDRARGRTKLEFRAWLRALEAEVRRTQVEAPAGWSSQPSEDHRTSNVIAQRASSFSFSR
jgi:hypothetical protein